MILKRGKKHLLFKVRHSGYDFLQFTADKPVKWRSKPERLLKDYAAFRHSAGANLGDLPESISGLGIPFVHTEPITDRISFARAAHKALSTVSCGHGFNCSYADYQVLVDYDRREVIKF